MRGQKTILENIHHEQINLIAPLPRLITETDIEGRLHVRAEGEHPSRLLDEEFKKAEESLTLEGFLLHFEGWRLTGQGEAFADQLASHWPRQNRSAFITHRPVDIVPHYAPGVDIPTYVQHIYPDDILHWAAWAGGEYPTRDNIVQRGYGAEEWAAYRRAFVDRTDL